MKVTGLFHNVTFQPGAVKTQLAAAGAASATGWPAVEPASRWLPKVESISGVDARASAIGITSVLAGALRNASMTAYWNRVPSTKAMADIWGYELKKRVNAGTLALEDAIGIFNTAVLGAEAQGFKPTGDRMSAVHKSATDFLASAEAVYFAKKKKATNSAAATPTGQDANAADAKAPTERVAGEEFKRRRRAFNAMRSELWKEEARRNPETYSHEQLQRMQQGKAPMRADGESMEIHHRKALSEGGTNTWENFEFLMHTAHRQKPNFTTKHPNMPRGRSK